MNGVSVYVCQGRLCTSCGKFTQVDVAQWGSITCGLVGASGDSVKVVSPEQELLHIAEIQIYGKSKRLKLA